MSPLLKAKALKKAFYFPHYAQILNGIDLTVMQGESVAIVGRSGEGKSTLLQILGTLEQPCEGVIEICNEKVSPMNKTRIRNEQIGFVFQSFHLLEDYTALENVLMPALIGGRSTGKGSTAYQRAMNLLAHVGLDQRAHFPSKVLSGGEKQRVALARAMCNDPKIIFADEPSGNLDSYTADLIHDLLFSFVKDGKALVLVTHDKELAKRTSTCYELRNHVLESGSQ